MTRLKKWKLLALLSIFMATTILFGCSSIPITNNSNQIQSNQGQIQKSKTISDDKSTLDNQNDYYTGQLDKDLFQLTRINNKITAIRSEAYNLNITIGYDKNNIHYINSIIFNNSPVKEIEFKENIDTRPTDINKLGLSSDNKLLSIMLNYHYGTKLLVVNLKTGERFIFNDILKEIIGKYIEVLWAYSWAPGEEKIAVAYGNTSTCNLAIYDFKTKSLIPIPIKNSLIGTQKIIWNNNGNQLDFISEYPADDFNLYRYFLISNRVIEITKITPSEILEKYPDGCINLSPLPKSHP